MKSFWLDLGCIRYGPAFQVQEQLFQARLDHRLPPTLLLQECPPTFTLGRSGTSDNILASPQQLEQAGIEVIEVNRGGDVTYHGPGQLIVSPLLYLGDLGINANQYLHYLEDLLIQVVATYGLQAGKKPEYPGVWLGQAKIASVGIAVKHGYTFHGFSLNVCLNLAPFQLINPCGVPRMPVTSLSEVLGRSETLEAAKRRIRNVFGPALNLEFEEHNWPEIESYLFSNPPNPSEVP